MIRKIGLAALPLFCMPALALAGSIYSSTPTTSPARGTISPAGYTFAANTGTTTITVTPNASYMIGSVTLNGNPLAPSGTSGSGATYVINNIPGPQKVVANFVPYKAPALTAVLPNPLNVKPSTPVNILGSSSTVILPVGVAATYTWSVTPTGATLTPATGTTANNSFKATFNSATPGVYAVTLKLTAPGLSDSTTTTNVVVQSPAMVTSQACTSCHSGTQYLDYASSLHATNPYEAVSCPTCHNPGMALAHPGRAVTSSALRTVCVDCHSGVYQPVAPHYVLDNLTSARANRPAQYVTPNNYCSVCHNPHNPVPTIVHTQWAENIHADTRTSTQVWTGRALDTPDGFGSKGALLATATYTNSLSPGNLQTGQDCVRCHTTTGFINFVTSGYVNIQPWQNLAVDRAKEVLTCKACHSDTNGTVRTPPVAFQPYLGYSTTVATRSGTSEIPNKFSVTFTTSSLGKSDICVSCHSYGRTKTQASAAVLKKLNTYASYSVARVDIRLVGSHGTAIAAVPFLTTNDYVYRFAGQTYDLGAHGQVGVGNLQNTGTGGPCAGCHLGTDKTSSKGGHTFEAWKNFSSSTVGLQDKATCNNCHNFNPMSTQILTDARFGAFAAQSSVKRVLRKNLGYPDTKSLVPTAANPVRFYSGIAGETGDFKYDSRELYQGANLNSTFNTTTRQISWYVHGPVLVKQLLFDSLDVALHGHITGSIADIQNHVAPNGYLRQDQVDKAIYWFNRFGGYSRPVPFQ